MEVHPLLDIRFDESKEAALLVEMTSRASAPWQWQEHDAFGRPPENGSFYFHRDQRDNEPPCTLCIRREALGHLVVHAVVPDANHVHEIPINQYVDILREFDTLIAGPAAETLNGMTSMDTSRRTLEDYFSPDAVRLLERFCKTANIADGGSDLSDQEKWIDFLLHVHRKDQYVHCDTFRACLRAKKWWSEEGIPDLVHEFDFAMRLLRQADRQA